MLLNYFVSEVRQSASQNLSKKDGAVKTVMFFSERFCEADWRKFQNKAAARRPTWLTDGINGSCLCTLTFSVVDPVYKNTSCVRGGMAGSASALHADEVECGSVLVAMR